jgi:hypothetical protein
LGTETWEYEIADGREQEFIARSKTHEWSCSTSSLTRLCNGR